MKLTILIALLSLPLVAEARPRGDAADPLETALRSRDAVPVLVLLRSEPSATAMGGQRLAALQERVIERTGLAENVSYRWHTIPGFAARVDAAQLERLRADPDVAVVEPDYAGGPTLAESGPFIGADRAHRIGLDGSGVTVAVLDSGIDAFSPDVGANVDDEQCFCQYYTADVFFHDLFYGCCPDGTTRQHGRGAAADPSGHGTTVAGVIASSGTAAPVGIAPGAELVAVKIMDDEGVVASTAQVVAALDWIAMNRPDVRVVILGFGSTTTFIGHCDAQARSLEFIVESLRDRGTLFVAGSGNDMTSGGIVIPACLEAVTAVGAVYDTDLGTVSYGICTDETTAPDQVPCFSNSSAALDLLAPGVAITTSHIGGRVVTMTGTSYAAAHVAGAAAILLQVDPSLSAGEIEQLLRASGKPVVDPRNGLTTPRVDVFGAVLAADPPARRRPVERP